MKRLRPAVDVRIAASWAAASAETSAARTSAARCARGSSPRTAAAAPHRSVPRGRWRIPTGSCRRRRSARTPCPTPCPWPSARWTAPVVLIRASACPARSLVALRRIERELGDEALARGILARELLELIQIADARVDVLVDALQVRLIPLAHLAHLPRPRLAAARSGRSAASAACRNADGIGCGGA